MKFRIFRYEKTDLGVALWFFNRIILNLWVEGGATIVFRWRHKIRHWNIRLRRCGSYA